MSFGLHPGGKGNQQHCYLQSQSLPLARVLTRYKGSCSLPSSRRILAGREQHTMGIKQHAMPKEDWLGHQWLPTVANATDGFVQHRIQPPRPCPCVVLSHSNTNPIFILSVDLGLLSTVNSAKPHTPGPGGMSQSLSGLERQ